MKSRGKESYLVIAVVALLAAIMLSALPAHCITNGVAPDPEDIAYDAVGALGVTWRLGLSHGHADDADNAWFCTATLVTPSIVRTNSHCIVPYGADAPYAVRFRRALDGSIASGPTSFHAYVDYWTIGTNSPFADGHLAAPVTHIAPIPSIVASVQVGDEVIQAGWGRQGPTFGAGPATELRTCDNSVLELPGGGWMYYGQPYWSGGYPNACGANSWDSGGPLLIWVSTSGFEKGPVISYPELRVIGIIGDDFSGPLVTAPPAYSSLRQIIRNPRRPPVGPGVTRVAGR